jgi:hypothetical protein
MKVRMGFVSNSSSSSFVAFGKIFKSEDNIASFFSKNIIDEAKKESGEDNIFYALQDYFYRDNKLWMAHGKDNGFKEDEYFIGIMLADHIEEGNTEKYSFSDIVKQIRELPLSKPLELDECEFIATTRSC